MTHHVQIAEERADEKIRTMLNAFAGPACPTPSLRSRRRRSPSRRTLVVVAAALLALGLVVPGALALLGVLSETPPQFISDVNQPISARNAIERYVERTPGRTAALLDVRQVVTADTPDGTYYVYALGFAGGLQGTAVISSRTGGIAAVGYGAPVTCPVGWALQGGISMVELPGRTPLYMTGRTSDAVVSVDVLYPDGHSSPAAVSNGFFLAWVTPLQGGSKAEGFSPPVTLLARNSTGREIGRLTVRADGDIPPSPGQARQAVACG
jgi:hypothetical protein